MFCSGLFNDDLYSTLATTLKVIWRSNLIFLNGNLNFLLRIWKEQEILRSNMTLNMYWTTTFKVIPRSYFFFYENPFLSLWIWKELNVHVQVWTWLCPDLRPSRWSRVKAVFWMETPIFYCGFGKSGIFYVRNDSL